MLVTIGDLVDDVVVRLAGPIRPASDTESVISRRRGGSAANVAATAAGIDGTARFIGQVGDDSSGRALTDELAADGVDIGSIRRAGETGTIIVLVDETGERTMLTDRRSCADLDHPDPSWLEGADVLHVPLYSLVGGELASTALTLTSWATERAMPVSIDLSSIALLDQLGDEAVAELIRQVAPAIVFANDDEAGVLDRILTNGQIDLDDSIVVRKHGGRGASITTSRRGLIECPTTPIARSVDTTGAGDAFAAGFLVAIDASGRLWRRDVVAAAAAGHAAAVALLESR